MSLQPKHRYTPEEYLAIERKSDHKSEFLDGEIFAVGGASPRHVLIVTNVVSCLHHQLRKRPCGVYSADLRVKVSPTGLYTYPDVVVLCEEPQFDDTQKDTLLNPTLIIEVLSDSTKDYDRGGKFEQYRTLRSLREYVLIAQDKHHVEDFVRQSDSRWVLSETNQIEDAVELTSIACRLPLADIYEKVGSPRR